MLSQFESRIAGAVSQHILIRYGVEIPVALEQPKQTAFGEFALPVAFQLARQLKKAPRAIAEELASELPAIKGVKSLEVAGGGYINLRLDRGALGASAIAPATAMATAGDGKVIVEHTNINPNKAAHIGHLRNAILGDTFVRMLRESGQRVEVQNYIDNTGVQVADVVVGFHYLDGKTPADVRALIAKDRFDYYCWDLYAKISQHYKDNPDSLQWRSDTLHAIEAGEGELADLGRLVADAIVVCHLNTMLRLGIQYDVLPRESEILHLKFWASAFEQLKERKAIYLEAEGKNSGCWVMPGSAFDENREDEDSKVIVRSNGTVTYVGKDIAYQMWKFGLLGKDFYYTPLRTYGDGHPVYVSTASPDGATSVAFGGGRKVYNVIDSRQSYLQDVVVAGLKALNYHEQAANSIHFSYEMVALSPRACVEMGIELSAEDQAKAYVEVSGRKGLGVKADDLIDSLINSALAEVASRNQDKSADDQFAAASAIAIGALRYFMLKFTRNTVIAFDFQEALSFTGETGPYVQYGAVRAAKILQKAGDLPDFATVLTAPVCARLLEEEGLWQYLLAVSRTDQAIAAALSAGEPAHMARYAFQLAQQFANFYHDYPVIQESDAEKRSFLLWLTAQFRAQLERSLRILGIGVPAFM
ncbi:MAG: arginine--tRNA ligase [Acidobacteria bacterium]|nr:arginine--tRNA ligase [Acidobacteriota bacterium]